MINSMGRGGPKRTRRKRADAAVITGVYHISKLRGCVSSPRASAGVYVFRILDFSRAICCLLARHFSLHFSADDLLHFCHLSFPLFRALKMLSYFRHANTSYDDNANVM